MNLEKEFRKRRYVKMLKEFQEAYDAWENFRSETDYDYEFLETSKEFQLLDANFVALADAVKAETKYFRCHLSFDEFKSLTLEGISCGWTSMMIGLDELAWRAFYFCE